FRWKRVLGFSFSLVIGFKLSASTLVQIWCLIR
ncbi:hypothetical protein CMV_022942, partial [Castanea mollissima]